MADPLPRPTTAQDKYAHALVMELRAINAGLQRLNGMIGGAFAALPADPADGSVELREPRPENTRPKPKTREAKRAESKSD